jgi:hypothetical protein
MPANASPLKPEILTEDDIRSEALARNLERLAWLMDRSLQIPGTKLRVGLDAILGLFPIGGDLLCGLIQSGLVMVALKHYRVPKVVAARMAANVLIDIAVGSIPFVGDAFDAVFKANTLNLKLLGEVRQLQSRGAPVPSAPSVGYLIGIGAILLLALGLIFVGMVTVAALIFKAINH